MIFLLLGLVGSVSFCKMCLDVGKKGVKLAEAGASDDEIFNMVLSSCDPLGPLFSVFCKESVKSKFDVIVKESRNCTKSVAQYCIDLKLCKRPKVARR